MRTVAFIQARSNSTRLPNKAWHVIEGRFMIEHVIRRTRQIGVDGVYLVIPEGDKLESFKFMCGTLTGHPTDVLFRFIQAAHQLGLNDNDRIVRITGDCPGLDPAVSREVVEMGDGYCHNLRDWPDGLDTEVFPVGMLRCAWLGPDEHVTSRMGAGNTLPLEPPQRFRKWSVDDASDLEYVRTIYRVFGDDWGWKDVLRLEAEPGLACQLCDAGVGHPRATKEGIGDKTGGYLWDLHDVTVSGGSGWQECTAYEVLKRRRQ